MIATRTYVHPIPKLLWNPTTHPVRENLLVRIPTHEFERNGLERILTMKPKQFGHNKKNKKEYRAFFCAENPSYGRCILIPRGLTSHGNPSSAITTLLKEPVFFEGELRPYQKQCCDEVLKELEHTGSHIIQADCGLGKTVMSSYLISCFQGRTLVVVHTSSLADQWRERLGEFCPQLKTQIVAGGRNAAVEDDTDCLIVMIQTLVSRRENRLNYRASLVVYDECHHICAESFLRSLNLLNAPCVLGLSATPHRNDGLTDFIYYCISPKSYVLSREQVHLQVFMVKTKCVLPEKRMRDGNLNYSRMLSGLMKHETRKKLVLYAIQKFRQRFPGRRALVLSARKCILTYLHEKISDSGLYVGGATTKKDKRAREKTSTDAQVVLATHGVAAEGLDLKPAPSMLFLVCPSKSIVQQAVGRVTRAVRSASSPPVVVDFVDDFSVFRYMAKSRERFYKEKGYKVKHM